MRASPIQLLQLLFKRVHIELDPTRLPEEIPHPLQSSFTFDGVKLHTEVSVGEGEPDPERGRIFMLELRVWVDNAEQAGEIDQRFSPYTLDVVAEGMVLIPNGAEALAAPEDLAIVNGASLLWSAAREQVLAISSRMRAGPVMLPTVHFHDLKGQATLKAPAAAPHQSPEAKKPRRAKAAAPAHTNK